MSYGSHVQTSSMRTSLEFVTSAAELWSIRQSTVLLFALFSTRVKRIFQKDLIWTRGLVVIRGAPQQGTLLCNLLWRKWKQREMLETFIFLIFSVSVLFFIFDTVREKIQSTFIVEHFVRSKRWWYLPQQTICVSEANGSQISEHFSHYQKTLVMGNRRYWS